MPNKKGDKHIEDTKNLQYIACCGPILIIRTLSEFLTKRQKREGVKEESAGFPLLML